MFERARRSWSLMREAWDVLRQDRGLVLFPIMSAVCSLLVIASFAVPFLMTLPWGEMARNGGSRAVEEHFGPLHYAALFLFYLATYFVVVFFNTGLIACVRTRLAGGEPTVRDGMAFATANVGRIFQWAMVSATVGTILRALEDRAGWLGRLVIGLIGMAWSLATAFAVPVLVYEEVGPFEAVTRSAAALRRTWGETVVANISLGAAFGLLFLPGLAVVVLGAVGGFALLDSAPAMATVLFVGSWVVAIGYWTALAVVQNTLQSIFLTACYEYATTGEVPSAFSRAYIVEAWRPKTGKR